MYLYFENIYSFCNLKQGSAEFELELEVGEDSDVMTLCLCNMYYLAGPPGVRD